MHKLDEISGWMPTASSRSWWMPGPPWSVGFRQITVGSDRFLTLNELIQRIKYWKELFQKEMSSLRHLRMFLNHEK